VHLLHHATVSLNDVFLTGTGLQSKDIEGLTFREFAATAVFITFVVFAAVIRARIICTPGISKATIEIGFQKPGGVLIL
jgi:hypothetical protein